MFPHDPLPERIGPYRILRHLSTRGRADLYLGEHVGPLGFQRTCVLKLVPGPSSDDGRSSQELAQEAKICAKLNHPAIVRMHDFFEYGDRLVLVFEHFAGVALSRLLAHLRRRRLEMPDPAAWFIAHQLFSALAHAHALADDKGQPTPVIHRDVQPDHVIVSADGWVRLTGFGIAKIVGTVGDTAVGFIKGTPAYMAPEQARGEKVTERADAYAAALVVWEMLAGRTALPKSAAKPGVELLRMISGRRVESISSVRKDIPREIAAAMDACLEPSPERRTIRCADVERWLKKLVDVSAGQELLRERLVQMRNVSGRPPPPSTVSGSRTSVAPKSPESCRVPPRFPGVATRLTGRVSTVSQGAPPSRRFPGVRGSRSRPAPPMPSSQPVQDAGKGTAGILGTVDDFDEALRAPRVPSLPQTDTSEGQQPTSSNGPQGGVFTPRGASVLPRAARGASAAPAQLAMTQRSAVPGVPEPNPDGEPQAVPSVVLSEELGSSDIEVLTHGDHGEVGRRDAGEAQARESRRIVSTLPPAQRFRPAVWVAVGAGGICAVILAGLVAVRLVHRGLPSNSAPEITPSQSHAPSVSGVAPVVSSVPPVASSEIAATVEPSARPATVAASIPPNMAQLRVQSPPTGAVYLHGKAVGETDTTIQVPCGTWFVRVGTALGPEGLKKTSWLADGQSVRIPCGELLTVSATPPFPTKGKRNRDTNREPRRLPKAPF